MKRKAIITVAVTAMLGIAAPALAGGKASPPTGKARTTTTITNGGRHFK